MAFNQAEQPRDLSKPDIDLGQLKKGDTVHFRCGGEAVVKESNYYGEYYYRVKIEGHCSDLTYSKSGKSGKGTQNESPLDIIKITHAAFDWDTVKPGMAFDIDGELTISGGVNRLWYLNTYPYGDGFALFGEMVDRGDVVVATIYRKSCLTRALEHDIDV